MKRIFILILILVLISSGLNSNSVHAKFEHGSLSSRITDTVKDELLIFGITELSYTIYYILEYDDSLSRGSSGNIKISLYGGYLKASIKNINYNQETKLGEVISIPFSIFYILILAAETNPEVKGSASIDTDKLIFWDEAEHTFKVTVDDRASIGDLVEIKMPFKLILEIGPALATPPPFGKPARIIYLDMTPILYARISVSGSNVSESILDQYLALLIVATIVPLIGTAIFIIMKLRKAVG